MDAQRRQILASTALSLLPGLERAIIESWRDLLPAASAWTVAERGEAREAIRAILRGVAGVIAQGDLDDRSWEDVRAMVLAQGRATPEEGEALVRTVRVPGVEALLHRLDEEVGLTGDERWTLQVQIGWFCDQLTRDREDFDPQAMQELLGDLERDGPDLA